VTMDGGREISPVPPSVDHQEHGAAASIAGKLHENRSWLGEGIHELVGTVWHNDSPARKEVEQVAGEFVKDAALFTGRRAGLLGTAVLYGLDNMQVDHKGLALATDFSIGVGKGVSTKAVFNMVGKLTVAPSIKGMVMGSTSRLVDQVFTPGNFYNNQHFDATGGALNALKHAYSLPALAADAATFGLAHGALKVGNLATAGKLGESVVATTVFNGATFGATSGAMTETQRQYSSNNSIDPRNYDFGKILAASGKEMAVTGLASLVGHKLTGVSDHSNANTNALADATVSGTTMKTPPASNDNVPGARSLFEPPSSKLPPLEISRADMPALPQTLESTSDAIDMGTRAIASALSDYPIPRPMPRRRFHRAAISQPVEPVLYPGMETSYSAPEWDNLRLRRIEEVPLSDLLTRLGPAENGTYTRRFVDASAEFGSWDEYIDSVQKESRDAIVYKIRGTEVVVPADYHAQLEEVRQLQIERARVTPLMEHLDPQDRDALLRRVTPDHIKALEQLIADNPDARSVNDLKFSWQVQVDDRIELSNTIWPKLSSVAHLSPKDLSDTLPIFKANIELEEHPLSYHLLPEHLVPVLERLPNPSLIKCLELLNETNVDDLAHRHLEGAIKERLGDTFNSAATADFSTGTVHLYRARSNSNIAEILKHEQVHLNHDELYGVARALDAKLEASKYGYTNDQESEAELEAKAFLAPQLSMFLQAGEKAPLRMALLARKLTDTIQESPAEYRSFDQQEILARAKYIETKVLPGVINDLMAKVIETVDPSAMSLLAKLNEGQSDPAVQEALLSRFVPAMHERIASMSSMGTSFKGYQVIARLMEVLSAEPQAQERLLLDWAQPGSPVSVRDVTRSYITSKFSSGFEDHNIVSDDLMAVPPVATSMSTGERALYSLNHGDDFQMRLAAFKLRHNDEKSDIPAQWLDDIINPNRIEPNSVIERLALLPDTSSKEAWMSVFLKSIDSMAVYDPDDAVRQRRMTLQGIADRVPELRAKAQSLLTVTSEQGDVLTGTHSTDGTGSSAKPLG
jgi:hypothetical protein